MPWRGLGSGLLVGSIVREGAAGGRKARSNAFNICYDCCNPIVCKAMSSFSSSDGTATPWTLGAIRRFNLQLEARCCTPPCGWFGAFDLDQLVATLGEDYELPTDGPDMPCPKCGAIRLKFQLASLHRDPEA